MIEFLLSVSIFPATVWQSVWLFFQLVLISYCLNNLNTYISHKQVAIVSIQQTRLDCKSIERRWRERVKIVHFPKRRKITKTIPLG